MNTVIKQPSESFIIGADFSQVLQEDETIILQDSRYLVFDLDNPTENTLTIFPQSLMTTPDRKTLMGRIEDGINEYQYKVSFIAVTDKGNTFEEDIKVKMVD